MCRRDREYLSTGEQAREAQSNLVPAEYVRAQRGQEHSRHLSLPVPALYGQLHCLQHHATGISFCLEPRREGIALIPQVMTSVLLSATNDVTRA